MKRGDIWLADLGYLGKVRPVLILSIAPGEEDRALVTYVIRTTSMRGTAYEVAHMARGMKNGVFDAQGIGTTDFNHFIRRLGDLDVPVLEVSSAASTPAAKPLSACLKTPTPDTSSSAFRNTKRASSRSSTNTASTARSSTWTAPAPSSRSSRGSAPWGRGRHEHHALIIPRSSEESQFDKTVKVDNL